MKLDRLFELLPRGSAGQELTKNHGPLESQTLLAYLRCAIHILIDGHISFRSLEQALSSKWPTPWQTFALSENAVTFMTSAHLKQMTVDLEI